MNGFRFPCQSYMTSFLFLSNAFERKRNDVIYDWQGNRNPFIDYPEFVNYIYSEEPTINSIQIENVQTPNPISGGEIFTITAVIVNISPPLIGFGV